ncbi:MAG: tripartite tricarboxylate transporter substrate-binding protein [Burkholderiaceae bacterium]
MTKLLVGFQAGGGFDAIARALGEGLRSQLNSTVIVENKPGAAGRLAAESVARAPADGSTLLVTPSSVLTLFPHTVSKLPYDPLRDLVQVARLASFDYGFAINTSSNITTLRQYIDAVKANKELGAYGTPGAGLTPHFIGMILARETGTPLLHVPYKGTAPAIQDLMGNQIPAVCATAPALVTGHRSGRLRVLATTGSKRNPDLPDVPTFAETGVRNLLIEEWAALSAPAGMAKDTVDRLSKAALAALADSKLQAQFKLQGFYPARSSPEEAALLLKAEYDRWKSAVRVLDFKPE